MPPFGLAAALLAAASGITAAAFALDAYVAPRMQPVASISAGTSTHQRDHVSPLAGVARTRFVAVEAAAPRTAPGKPKTAPNVAASAAKTPAGKGQPAKDHPSTKARKAQQAAAPWPWSVLGN